MRTNFDFETRDRSPAFEQVPAPGARGRAHRVRLYAQDAWNPTARLGITGGLRLDDYSDFGASVQPAPGRRVPRCRADLNLKPSYGRARARAQLPRALLQPPRLPANADLEPARIDSFDAAVLYRRKDLRAERHRLPQLRCAT